MTAEQVKRVFDLAYKLVDNATDSKDREDGKALLLLLGQRKTLMDACDLATNKTRSSEVLMILNQALEQCR